MNKLTVNVSIEEDLSLLAIIKQLGEQANKAYVVIDSTELGFPIIYSDDKYLEATGFTEDEVVNHSFYELLENNRYQNSKEYMQDMFLKEQMFTAELLHKKRIGTFNAEIQCLPFQRHYYLVLVEDITVSQLEDYTNHLERQVLQAIEQRVTFEEQMVLLCSEIDKLFNPYTYTAITLLDEGVLTTMLSNRFDAAQAYFDVTIREEAAFYKRLMEKKQVVQVEGFDKLPINAALKQQLLGQHYQNCWLVPIMTAQEEVIGVLNIFLDIQKRYTEAYKYLGQRLMEIITTVYELNQQQRTIKRLAYIDQATGLPNMHQFMKILKQLEKDHVRGIIKIVEPGEFSTIAELYGRETGEALLKQLGARVREASTSTIFHIARFTSASLIIFSTRDFEKVRHEANPFPNLTTTPFQVKGMSTYITLKSGFAAFNPSVSHKDSIRFAEVALKKARKTAGTQTEYYEGQMDAQLKKEMQLLNHLTEAIQKKEIQTYFQPKVTLYRGRIASVEALARWDSPELGFVSPADFIPIAENAGLICEIDVQMLEQILRWMQQRQYEGKKIVPVAINISPIHFYHPEFIVNIKRLLKTYYADPNFIIIEVTEGIGLADLNRAKSILQDLRDIGLRTSVDDFGIGYSSLSYLQNFSFNELKIDRSFTWKIDEAGTYAIVKAIIEIAHTLNMAVVAEGVETAEQANLLSELHCDKVQGYYYFKPMPMEEFSDILDGK